MMAAGVNEPGHELDAGTERAHEVPAHPPVAPLRNTWLALTHASRVKSHKPLRRAVYNTPIVVWRGANGELAAMEDRCPHRRAPLSAGKVVEGELQCAYHGWTYDTRGACVRIPSLGPGAEPGKGIRVRTYPTLERYGFVWIWWGDAGAADPALVPDIPFIDPQKPKAFETRLQYDCAPDLLVENVLDLTHLDFVHGGLLGDPYGGAEEVTCTHTSEVLTMQRRSEGRRPPLVQAALFGFPKRQDYVGTSRIYLRSNLIVSGVSWDPPGWGQFVVMSNIPETTNRIRNEVSLVVFAPAWYRKLAELASGVVARQDNSILKLQHPAYHELGHLSGDRADVSVAGDKASLRYRALRRDLLERQARGDFAYAEGWHRLSGAETQHFPRVW